MFVILFWKIRIHTPQKVDTLIFERQEVFILTQPPNLLIFENFFFHTISIKEMYMLIKHEGVANIFNDSIQKVTFLGCLTSFEHDQLY